jgi:redox-sensitive bicupin YhaK (pirin superfamily)
MLPQSKGKIFLADERGLNQLDWFRSYNTFNFGKYYNEHKTPFGALYVLNEDTLAPGRSITMEVEEDSDIILIPVVGAVTWRDSAGNTALRGAGQSLYYSAPKGTSITISNPYEDALVNFLQIWIKKPATAAALQLCDFDLNNHKDRLLPIFNNRILLGQFNGRAETTLPLPPGANGLFVFVIQGAFEVQYRLMNAKDGLALWALQEIELEALSNEAIVLVVPIPAHMQP